MLSFRKFLSLPVSLVPIAMFVATMSAAQQADIAGLSDFPVPAWPADNKVPPSTTGQYVFVDLPKNEYVVAYPENLGTEAFAQNPGAMKITRYELLRNVGPTVSAAVSSNAGKFTYSYTIANAGTAKQSIDQFVLVLPEPAAKGSLQHPDGWFGILQKSRTFKLKNPEWIKNGAAAVWSFQKVEQVVQPGDSKTGFQLESDLRPGFTVAYFRRATSVDVKVATHGNVPKEVKEQIDEVLAIEYNSRTALTLGPKFDSAADDKAIADDFIQGIFTLSRAGLLDLSSDFVRGTMNELTGVQPGRKAAPLKLPAARTPLETEILNALKAALP